MRLISPLTKPTAALLLLALGGLAQPAAGQTVWTRATLADTNLTGLVLGAGGYLFATPKLVLEYPPGPPALPLPSPDGVYRSLDGGVTWERTGNGVAPSFSPYRHGQAIFPRHAERHPPGNVTLWGGLFWGGLARSEDLGQTWTDVSAGLPLNGNRPEVIADVATVGGVVYALTSAYGLWRSADRGATWASFGQGLQTSPNAPEPALFFGLAADVQPDGTATLFVSGQLGLFRRASGASSFVRVLAGLSVPSGPYAGEPFEQYRTVVLGGGTLLQIPQYAYDQALGGSALYRSEDGGLTWTGSDAGLHTAEAPLNRVFGVTVTGDVLLAGARGGAGVYVSTNAGLSWQPQGEGLPFEPTCCGQPPQARIGYTPVVVGQRAIMFAGLFATGQGLYTRSLDQIVNTEAAPTPEHLRVEVAPNPSRSGAARLVLPPSGPDVWRLTVSDALGRVVWTATAPGGEMALPALPPGVYAVRAESTGRAATSRFVVVR